MIDGVGGHDGGEVAAQIAQDSIVKYLEKYPNGERLDLLKQAVICANNNIFEERQNKENLTNMSCVLTAVLIEIEKHQINMVHIGDTRLYQYQNDKLQKLSHDHSLIGYREEIGELTENEAMRHPQRNIISRDVGSAKHDIGDDNFIESSIFNLMPNSILLLCSDGLSDMITSVQIIELLQSNITVENKVTELINAANTQEGRDNITVVLIEYKKDSTKTTVVDQSNDSNKGVSGIVQQSVIQSSNNWLFLILTGMGVFVLGLIIGWFIAKQYYSTQRINNNYDYIIDNKSLNTSKCLRLYW